VRILLTGNIYNLGHPNQVAVVKAAFAALPFVDQIKTVCYMNGMKGVAVGHLQNSYEIRLFDLDVSIEMDIDAVVVVAVEGVPLGFVKSLIKTGKPVYLIDAMNPIVIAHGWNLSSAEVCRIRGWNVGDVVSDGIALRAIDRIEEFAVYGRLCNDNQFEFGDEQQLLLDLRYKKEEIDYGHHANPMQYSHDSLRPPMQGQI
jgi:hypothetical protein